MGEEQRKSQTEHTLLWFIVYEGGYVRMAENLKARDGNRLYKAQLLSYYYSRRAESAIGKGARFVISKAYWCKSSLVTANGAGGWNIADIPLDF
ncbi:hypothetical protein HTZ85_26120 [Escherichia coli]|nr:hypothetical protein [Escherichia coli]